MDWKGTIFINCWIRYQSFHDRNLFCSALKLETKSSDENEEKGNVELSSSHRVTELSKIEIHTAGSEREFNSLRKLDEKNFVVGTHDGKMTKMRISRDQKCMINDFDLKASESSLISMDLSDSLTKNNILFTSGRSSKKLKLWDSQSLIRTRKEQQETLQPIKVIECVDSIQGIKCLPSIPQNLIALGRCKEEGTLSILDIEKEVDVRVWTPYTSEDARICYGGSSWPLRDIDFDEKNKVLGSCRFRCVSMQDIRIKEENQRKFTITNNMTNNRDRIFAHDCVLKSMKFLDDGRYCVVGEAYVDCHPCDVSLHILDTRMMNKVMKKWIAHDHVISGLVKVKESSTKFISYSYCDGVKFWSLDDGDGESCYKMIEEFKDVRPYQLEVFDEEENESLETKMKDLEERKELLLDLMIGRERNCFFSIFFLGRVKKVVVFRSMILV